MQEDHSNQQLIQKSKQGIVMSILNAVKYEKKRSQSTRPRTNPKLLNISEFGQQNSSILNQTTDNSLFQSDQDPPQNFLIQHNESGTRKILISTKHARKYENNFLSIDKYSSNNINKQSNNQQTDLQRYFSQQASNLQDLPLPYFPHPYENDDNYNMANINNGQLNNYLTQNQIASALETPKFNINHLKNNEMAINEQDGFDNDEEDNIQFELIHTQEESPQQISLKDKVNSRRNEFFSFGKSRSSLSQQNPTQMSYDNLKKVKKIDDELFENDDFQNIIINNPNFPPLPSKQNNKLTSKSPTSYLLTEISQNQNLINDQLQAQQNNKLMNTVNLSQKQNKSVIPFKVKNIPKGSNLNILKLQVANQTKLSSSPMNGYTFYNYIDKENCSISLPKSDSIQFRNNNKSPIQASHSIQLASSSSYKIPKQQLIPPSANLQQNQQQKMSGSLHLRSLIQQKQGKNHSMHLKQLQTLNDSFNSTNANKRSKKMIQNQSFDNIQQSLMQPSNNPHKRSQQDTKNSITVGGLMNIANHNNSFEIGKQAIDSFIHQENFLKIPSKQMMPTTQINKNQRQLSAKKSIKQGTSQSFHQRMKTIM